MRTTAGYNELNSKDFRSFPKSSRSPNDLQSSSSSYGYSRYNTWNIEPQLEFKHRIGPGNLSLLLGTTFQNKNQDILSLNLSGYSSDALLQSIQAASIVNSKSNYVSQYRYQAIFGRLNYNVKNRYLLNITGRRDGSSRFANFGAVGAAWVLTEEKWLKDVFPVLSFAKLRSSIGITGNDQIGDYQYLDAWGPKSGADGTYQGNTALFPLNLYNPVYGWEENKKFELALDLGLLQDRIFLNVDFYRNRSNNQLVKYKLPYTTGFGAIISNFPAMVEIKVGKFRPVRRS